jgi:putative transcriptional regulator
MEPGLLMASPQMQDTNFANTVVLLAHHSPQGALGLVINREHTVRLGEILPAARLKERASRLALWGGPVEPGAGFVIFKGTTPEGWNLACGLAVSASKERLMGLIDRQAEFLLCLGYAGWGPGQLDREFQTGSWVYTEASLDLVFETPVSERYAYALARLGVRAQDLWMNPIDE